MRVQQINDVTGGAHTIANVYVNEHSEWCGSDNSQCGYHPGECLTPQGISFNTATGEVIVAPGTPSGSYTFDYQICDKLDPTICDIATVTVPVVANFNAVNDISPAVRWHSRRHSDCKRSDQ